jgi:uroporphyrinogen-III synthase
MNSLANQVILVTRPQHQAKELAENIEGRGGNPILFPTLSITPPSNKQALQKIVGELTRCDITIFVSANAVQYAAAYFPDPYPLMTNIAIGPATQKMLAAKGVKPILLPKEFNTDGLLQMPTLQNVANKKIMIFAGESSKPLLADNLRARGANLLQPVCYQRQRPQYPDEVVNRLLVNKNIDTIISTSLESLKNLFAILGSDGLAWLQQRKILVISQRMLQYAQQNNLSNIILADDATNAAIIKALENDKDHE